ncbi:glycosyltransferase (plasmid) [Priestia megaterium]|uniref:glycosyltransferase n=1 Tax=Priestia megaterium TaxID=1404 RepID=UPI002ED42BDB|nr:glycosyltransferase [Priestia megaterium]
MLHDIFLTFNGSELITTKKQIFSDIKNTFTIEFWAKPEVTHGIVKQSRKGILQTSNQRFVIAPVFGAIGAGNHFQAGVGVSVGTNGVSVYEHTTDYLAATLVYAGPINDWTHIAVIYIDKVPNLYINGVFIKKGFPSGKKFVVPSGVFGGLEPYGFYVGTLKEIRIWSIARTQLEIEQNINQELKGNELGLFSYWKLNEGSGVTAHDSALNRHDGSIQGAKWNYSQNYNDHNSNINILFTFHVPSGGIETLNRQRFYALNNKGVNCDFLYAKSGIGLQNKINTSIFITKNDNEIKDIILKGNYEAVVVSSDFRLLKKIKDFGYTGSLIYEVQGLGFNKEYADDFLRNEAYSVIKDYCDGILYPQTPHLIQAFEKYFSFKKKFCFHNCFNTEDFRYQIHPKEDRPIIGWVGRIEENKNWKDFLSIGAKLIQENASIQLWMFEDNTLSTPAERLAFERKIEELNLKSNLTIHANRPHSEMAKYFSIIGDSGGFLCSTSKVEGFGYAVLEAMICRCPVLSSDSDGVRSFIKHNLTGKFFTLENIDQAVQEGKELLSNIPLREKIRRKAVEHIETYFSPDEYAKNFLNMIQDIKNVNK